MRILKAAIYCVTIAAVMFFGFWELRLKRQLTDGALQRSNKIIDVGIMDDLSDRIRREQTLKELPKRERSQLRMVVMSKLVLIAALIAEVLILQR